VLPGETVVIAAAVLAANGSLSIVLVVVTAAVGALLGDNVAYGLGRGGVRRLAERLLDSDRNRLFDWARRQLQRHGVWIIIVARFIPGGRTATTYAAGTLGMPCKRRFLPAAAAALLWALYSSALGCLGGATFENNLWLPLLVAAATTLVVAAGGELLRRRVLDRREDRKAPRSSSRAEP
jgi:membrane protein DedA with SNARE-associated domain